jgi:L-threonylcarbamoyladenylate synthase
LIVHVASAVQATQCVADWPESAELLARRFWPGPLTLVLPRSEIIPNLVTAGKSTVGVRLPASAVARGLIECACQPLAAPSANRSNRLSPTRAEHVLADLDGRIELVLDSGPTSVGLESSVLDLTCTPPRLLRPGPVSSEELEAALAVRLESGAGLSQAVDRPSSPGQMSVHYAPRTPAYRVDSTGGLERIIGTEEVAVIVVGSRLEPAMVGLTRTFSVETPEAAAQRLYDLLHQCDQLGLGRILIIMPPARPEWQAVRDRLLRATRPLVELSNVLQ